jgi:hypothetical protein
MVQLQITNWYGRLGNNIRQLINVISIGLENNYNIIIPEHKFFNKTEIIINKNNIINKDTQILSDTEGENFFYTNKIMKFGNDWKINFKKNFPKTINIIRDLFIIKYNDLEKLDKNSLTIHIRSGDLFDPFPHSEYIVPPLSYYINIIEQYVNSGEIYLLAEDRKNPVINILLKLHPKIKFKISTLEEDVKMVLRSINIVSSFGTFIPSLLLLTDYTQKVYTPSYIKNNFTDYYINNIISIDLDDYKNKIGKWKNSPEQREILINYNNTKYNIKKNNIKKNNKYNKINLILSILIIMIFVLSLNRSLVLKHQRQLRFL